MTKVLAAAALAAAMLAGTAVSSYAAVIVPAGAVDQGNGNFAGTASTGSFTQYFSFTIPLLGSYTVNGSLTTAPGSAVTFSAFNFTDLMGNVLETGDEGIKLSKGKVVPDPKNFTLDDYTFTAGSYYVEVMGSGAANAPAVNYGFTGNLSVTMNPVPLPSSVGLFGVALAGLGVAGVMRRKGQATA